MLIHIKNDLIVSRVLILGLPLLACLVLCSCNESGKSNDNRKYTYDTTSIAIPPDALDFYPKSTIDENEVLFVGYNYIDHSLDIINIADNLFIKKIPLQKEGPKKIGNIGYLFLQDSKLIIYSQPEWILLDTAGYLLKRFTLESVENQLGGKYVIDG